MNTRRFMFLVALVAGVVLLSSRAYAHHSTAEYDMANVSSIKGTVTKFEWTNPHAYIYVRTNDEGGKVSTYAFETSSPNALLRRGWKRGSE